MTKSIALLSGKGGSGKTTIALSLASLLSKCNIRCLLIDCDFSTNGATYFYENKLAEKDYLSLYDILADNPNYNDYVIIDDYLSFLPSVPSFEMIDTSNLSFTSIDSHRIKTFIQDATSKYEVLIFDCQAGYTTLLNYLLPNVDETLFVMEADAISSASIRNLHLKIGSFLKGNTTYQIFNKATPEEYDIYNKISGGTFFTNIETVLYDWKIRKAFALSEIPDMERTSAYYGKQILNISKILFKEDFYIERMKSFEKKILLSFTIEEKESLEEELKTLLSNKELKMPQRYKIITALWAFASIILLGTLVAVFLTRRPFVSLPKIGDSEIFGILIEAGSFITLAFIFLLRYIKNPDYIIKAEVIEKTKKKINELDKKIEELRKTII